MKVLYCTSSYFFSKKSIGFYKGWQGSRLSALLSFLFLLIGHLSFGQCPGPDCTAVPDANFEQKLIDLGIDDIMDGYVPNSAAEGVTLLDVFGSSISDLSGIEAFTNLTHLYCYSNQLTSLDVNENTKLTLLFCSENQLTSLDLSAHSALTDFHCERNQLTFLDVRNGNNTNLDNFRSAGNPSLSCITVDDPAWSTTNWTNVDPGVGFSSDCSTAIPDANFEQKLIDLGIDDIMDGYVLNSAAEGVTLLDVFGSSISDLSGIEAFTNLTHLYCYSNQLTSLDVNENTKLTLLFCSENQLTSLDLSAHSALTDFHCERNQLTFLDVRNGNNTNLNNFRSAGNPDLSCITVDDPAWSTANWTNVDPGVGFSSDCTTSTYDEYFDSQIEVYPNPTIDYVSIVGIEKGTLAIFDSLGEMHLSTTFSSSVIDISTLSNGVYFLQIRSNNKVATKKIIKSDIY